MRRSTEKGSPKKKVLLLGADGMLAHDLFEVFREEFEVVPKNRREVDITLETDVRRAILSVRPDVVLNAAGYTAVDRAEKERELALAVNGRAPGLLGRVCREAGALLVHFSTDYVFDGEKRAPYAEEDDTSPLNHYGYTKLLGEGEVIESGCEYLIIRTQWLFGPKGRNFVFSIVDRFRREGKASVVNDQVGCPTHTHDLALATFRLVTGNQRGIFHFSGEGETTWFDFARKIAELAVPEDVDITPIKSVDLKLPARRPQYSVLSKKKYTDAVGSPPRHWEEMLKSFLKRVFEGGVVW